MGVIANSPVDQQHERICHTDHAVRLWRGESLEDGRADGDI